jgi:hypothetical protein
MDFPNDIWIAITEYVPKQTIIRIKTKGHSCTFRHHSQEKDKIRIVDFYFSLEVDQIKFDMKKNGYRFIGYLIPENLYTSICDAYNQSRRLFHCVLPKITCCFLDCELSMNSPLPWPDYIGHEIRYANQVMYQGKKYREILYEGRIHLDTVRLRTNGSMNLETYITNVDIISELYKSGPILNFMEFPLNRKVRKVRKARKKLKH